MFHHTKDLTHNKMSLPKALVVLSGGQDSSTCLFLATSQFGVENVSAVTFDYDQRHRLEINAAKNVAHFAGVYSRHEVVTLGPVLKGVSPLIDPAKKLEEYASFEEMDRVIGDRVEKTFVPMRNALFLTIAANRAAVLGATTIVTGVCQADNANYPDCRQIFISCQVAAINTALGYQFGSGGWIDVMTPLMNLSKAESIRVALSTPGAYSALAYTHTAYDGQFPPTSKDHASVLRARGFEEAGFPDPLVLRAWKLGAMDLPQTANYDHGRVAGAMEALEKELCHFDRLFPWWWDFR